MKFSYLWIKDFISKLPQPKSLADTLTLKSFEVEDLKKIGKDTMIDIDVLPNRFPDVNGHEGLAREISAILNKPFVIKKEEVIESKKSLPKNLKIIVKDKNLCTRYNARVIEGVKIKNSPLRIRDRLKTCGLNHINNLVDAANYIMLQTGQPLHIFDYDKIIGEQIIVRKAKKDEKIITLDNDEVILDEDILVIADKKGPIAIAGIKGGIRASVTKNTKRILLESAHFRGADIRKSMKKLGLVTDSALRFSAGLYIGNTRYAIHKLASLVIKVAGGEVFKGIIDTNPKIDSKKSILININNVGSLLGESISLEKTKDVLKRLGFIIKKEKKNSLIITPPLFRLDLTNKEDIIEEIGRIIGYEKIKAKPPKGELIQPKINNEIFLLNKLEDLTINNGFNETLNYVFESKKHIEQLNININEILKIKNPANEEYCYLRNSLIPGLLRNIKHNFQYTNRVMLFEIGKTFKKDKNKPVEKRSFTAVLADKKSSKKTDANLFFEAKGFISSILEGMGYTEYIFGDLSKNKKNLSQLDAIMHPFRHSGIFSGKELIGSLFEIHPELLDKLKIKGRVAVFDFNLHPLLKFLETEKEFRPISKFPSIVRDISVFVPRRTRVIEVLNVIERVGGKLLVDTDLFDYYEEDTEEEKRKSFAFHLIFQAKDRTLKDKEIDKLINLIIKTLEERGDWEVRK